MRSRKPMTDCAMHRVSKRNRRIRNAMSDCAKRRVSKCNMRICKLTSAGASILLVAFSSVPALPAWFQVHQVQVILLLVLLGCFCVGGIGENHAWLPCRPQELKARSDSVNRPGVGSLQFFCAHWILTRIMYGPEAPGGVILISAHLQAWSQCMSSRGEKG